MWDGVDVGPRSTTRAAVVPDAVLKDCVARHETTTSRGVVTASMGVPHCVADAARLVPSLASSS